MMKYFFNAVLANLILMPGELAFAFMGFTSQETVRHMEVPIYMLCATGFFFTANIIAAIYLTDTWGTESNDEG